MWQKAACALCRTALLVLFALAGCGEDENGKAGSPPSPPGEPPPPCESEAPSLTFTYVPPYGSFDLLQGRVCNADPAQFKVGVYIYVGGWWTKPYWIQPATYFAEDGTWACDITTGGSDHLATQIAAFLVPVQYQLPLMRGEATLPDDLYARALHYAVATRGPGGELPQPPTGLLAEFLPDRTVHLRWNDQSDTETQFVVYRQNQDGLWQEIGRAPENSTSFQDPNPGDHGTVCYRIAAVNDIGLSEPTEPTCVQIITPPAYRVCGFCFSPYMGGQDPNFGSAVPIEQLRERLRQISFYTNWIRTFGTSGALRHAGELAHQFGLKIAMGAWISRSPAANQEELLGLISASQAGEVDIACVGNEVLLRGDLTLQELIELIRTFKEAVPGVPVTTAEPYSVWLRYQELRASCDVLFVNIYPFWENVPFSDALADLHHNWLQVRNVAGDTPVYVSETGWPSGGDPCGEALPSPQNAASYFLSFVAWARTYDVPFFYFEAFDESWKGAYEPCGVGAHWGVFTEEGQLKTGMEAVFNNEQASDTWTRELPCGQGTPRVEFTFVPPRGSHEDLRGRVCHVQPAQYKLAVYIQVSGAWWTKPYWDRSATYLDFDGSWLCDITTGEGDSEATAIAAFLVPITYSIPLASGGPLPEAIVSDAVAHAEVTR